MLSELVYVRISYDFYCDPNIIELFLKQIKILNVTNCHAIGNAINDS